MLERSASEADKLFLGPLKKALEATNHRSRQTIMYGLSQQQSFIDSLNTLSNKLTGPEDKKPREE